MRHLVWIALTLFLVSACGDDAPPPDGGGGAGGGDGADLSPLDVGDREPETPPPADPMEKLKMEVGRCRNSVDPEERARAIELLRESGDKLFAGQEIEKFLQDKNADVRELAAGALGAIEYRGATPALTNLLKTEPESLVRMSAVRSLYQLAGKTAVPDLIRLLDEDDDDSVRQAAASLLGDLKSKLGVSALITRVEEDFNVGVRQASLVALNKIGSPRALDAAIDSLEDMNAAVRVAACDLIRSIGDEKAVPKLILALEEEEDDSVLKAATETLSKLTGEKLVYDPAGDADENEAVLQGWKDWWKENGTD